MISICFWTTCVPAVALEILCNSSFTEGGVRSILHQVRKRITFEYTRGVSGVCFWKLWFITFYSSSISHLIFQIWSWVIMKTNHYFFHLHHATINHAVTPFIHNCTFLNQCDLGLLILQTLPLYTFHTHQMTLTSLYIPHANKWPWLTCTFHTQPFGVCSLAWLNSSSIGSWLWKK